MDRISGLPDELCHRILSFLPARDAVCTCVLSPRWHHLWSCAWHLNVDAEGFTSQSRFVKFVNALLVSRGCTSLDSLSLDANGPGIFLENFRDTASLWICHALRSNVQALSITEHDQNDAFEMDEELKQWPDVFPLDHCPFTSSYLKRLHLRGVSFAEGFLKELFSGCPVLEDLDMINCVILDTEFSSVTLKNLGIDFDHFPFCETHGYNDIVINMPNLVSLRIGALLVAKPFFVDVQSLITASICLDSDGANSAYGCHILGALSNVKDLELLFTDGVEGSYPQGYTQLGQVVFTNLTTLSLSDWCLHDNCKALLHLLDHSPNLENLTLNLQLEDPRFRGDLSHSAAAVDSATPFNCEKLRKVDIICAKGGKIVGMLVTILLSKMRSPPEISIKPSGFPWDDQVKLAYWD